MVFCFHISAATSALTRALRKKSRGRFDTCLEPLGSQLKLKIGRGCMEHISYIFGGCGSFTCL